MISHGVEVLCDVKKDAIDTLHEITRLSKFTFS